MIIKSGHIHVQANNREFSEKKLGEEFNKWMVENNYPEIIKFFEPNRFDRLFGDYNYNEYHTSMTFFYKTSLPNGLKSL